MNRRRTSKFKRKGPRRLTDWIGGGAALETEFPIVGGAQLYDIIDLQDMDEHVDRMTVERVRGWIVVETRTAAIQLRAIANFGIYVTDVEQAGAETVLSSGALVDQDSELWMWRYTLPIYPDTDGTPVGGTWGRGFEVDVKARRVMEGRQKLVLSATLSVQSAGLDDVILYKNLRALVKLA